jgi:hypothetical protein
VEPLVHVINKFKLSSMKLFKFLSHPYTLVISFLFILISGEHLGGFYALYILLGLTHGVAHSLLGFFGILLLLISYHAAFKQKGYLRQVLNIIGVAMLIASVFYFFKNDAQRYNWGTFEEGLPMFTIIFTGFIAICFLIGNFWNPSSRSHMNQNLLSKI